MNRSLLVLYISGAFCSEALSMNWEGHDDWMVELPAAREFENLNPAKAPPTPKPSETQSCMEPEMVGKVRANPYENVERLCTEPDHPKR